MTPRRFRLLALAAGLIALGLVAYALYLQHVDYLDPCPLCIVQRYAFILAGLAALGAAAAGPSALGRGFTGLGALFALGGAGTAGWHVWILRHPATDCGRDLVEAVVNNLPTARWWPEVFYAGGLCGFPLPPVLGVEIPVWSVLWLSALAVVLFGLTVGRGTARR